MKFMARGAFILLLLWSVGSLSAQDVKLWSFDEFKSYMEQPSSKLKVINFWATWCAPCIKELPYFQELSESKSSNVEVLLVSLDFEDLLEKKVKPMISKKGISSPRLVLLNDENYNDWIDKVDPSWSGALPGTLFISSNGEKTFHEGELAREELFRKVKNLTTL